MSADESDVVYTSLESGEDQSRNKCCAKPTGPSCSKICGYVARGQHIGAQGLVFAEFAVSIQMMFADGLAENQPWTMSQELPKLIAFIIGAVFEIKTKVSDNHKGVSHFVAVALEGCAVLPDILRAMKIGKIEPANQFIANLAAGVCSMLFVYASSDDYFKKSCLAKFNFQLLLQCLFVSTVVPTVVAQSTYTCGPTEKVPVNLGAGFVVVAAISYFLGNIYFLKVPIKLS